MTDFLNFIKENWQFFTAAGLGLIELVLMLVFKKRSRILDCGYTFHLTEWIQEAEAKFKNGSDKLQYVLAKAKTYAGEAYNKDYTVKLVEWLLKLPQKKEK